MPQNARPIRRSQGKDYTRLAPVLKTLDVTNARQLRHAIAAPYDPRVEGANLGTRPEFHHHLGGPCVLNALLAKSGRHPPLPTAALRDLAAATGGDDVDADVEDMHPAASIAVYASTLAERRATSAELRGVHARDIAERLHKSKLSSPHALRRLALSGSDGALSDASRLPEPECVDLGELASIELRGDPDAVLRGEGTAFTAPHGVFLRREKLDAGTDFEDNKFETHHPEGWTTFLACAFAKATGGVAMTWCESERTRSRLFRAPNPALTDPNCVSAISTIEWRRKSPWTRLLARRPVGSAHVDVHGRRDPDGGDVSAEIGDGDCDVGVGALEAVNVELADSLRTALADGLDRCLARWRRRREARGEFDSPAYAVNARPVLTGRRPDGRLTLSQQGCALGLVSVQLELSMRLRRALVGDPEATADFACAIVEAFAGLAPSVTGRGEKTYAGIAALDEHVAKNARHDAKVARVLNAQLERIDLEREVERVRREVGYAPPLKPTYEHFPKSLARGTPHDVYFRRGLYDGEDSDSA